MLKNFLAVSLIVTEGIINNSNHRPVTLAVMIRLIFMTLPSPAPHALLIGLVNIPPTVRRRPRAPEHQ